MSRPRVGHYPLFCFLDLRKPSRCRDGGIDSQYPLTCNQGFLRRSRGLFVRKSHVVKESTDGRRHAKGCDAVSGVRQ